MWVPPKTGSNSVTPIPLFLCYWDIDVATEPKTATQRDNLAMSWRRSTGTVLGRECFMFHMPCFVNFYFLGKLPQDYSLAEVTVPQIICVVLTKTGLSFSLSVK